MLLHIKNNPIILSGRILLLSAAIPFFAGAADCQPQERLSLQKAVKEAVANSKILQSSKYEIGASKADEATAALRPNPMLTAIGDIGPSNGLGPADKYYGVSLGIPIELGGKRDKRIAYAEASTQLASDQYGDQVRQFTFLVQSAYIDFATTAEQLIEAKENLALLDSAVILSRYRVGGKDISVTELSRTEVERDKYFLQTAALENSFHAARITLLNLMGRSGASLLGDVQPDTTVFDPLKQNRIGDIPSLDSLAGVAENERPDIRALKNAEKADSANLELQKAVASIDLNVSLDLTRQTGVTFYGTTLSVPLKIFDRNQGEIEKADIRISQARANTEAALLKLRADLASARNDVLIKQNAVAILQNNVLQKSSDVRSAVEFAYRRGGTSLVDYLDAARTYNELRTSYYDALADYAKSLLTLNTIIGKDLFYEK